ncbi:MAG: HD domain-containing protein [Selenomonadaceae bacterium]|jgi:HD superfamily phosphodiesterase
MNLIGKIINAMIAYYAGDVRRINHFLKVYGFAKAIGEMEGLDESTQEILEIAALTHDIGIKNSEKKYNSSAGNYQQIEGPPEAKKLLERLGVESGIIDRVCWLIAHHHTYTDIQGIDYQILVEADFLVNFYEDNVSQDSIQSIRDKIFKTLSGKMILNAIYT